MSRGDLVNVAHLAYVAGAVRTREAAAPVWRAMGALLPIESGVCVLARWDADGGIAEVQQLFNLGYPPEWLTLYQERRYDRIDPVLSAYRAGKRPRPWSEVFREARTMAQRSFVEACTAFGLCEGLTLGLADGEARGSLLSFCGTALAHTPRHRTVLECLTPALHGMLVRLAEGSAGAATAGLTRRERETLHWASLGKTTWEIGRIVGISERTVMFHLGNAMRKLNARNRAQAIAKATLLGVLGRFR